jgi:hypothetical protein
MPGGIAGAEVYALGQIEPVTPAEFAASVKVPIWLLYRMLLGSALANIGACARAATPADPVSHRVGLDVPDLTIVGAVLPPGMPYWL